MLEDSGGAGANVLAVMLIFLGTLYVLAIIIPSIALCVRRLHDLNLTGWIYLGVVPGTKGPNEYGSDPKNPDGDIIDAFE